MDNMQMLVGSLTIEQFITLFGQILGCSFIFFIIFYLILRTIDFVFLNLFELVYKLIQKYFDKEKQQGN